MKKTLRIALLLALTLALALPLCLGVSAASEDPVTGYAYVSRYQSDWVGSTITTTSYGCWVKSDGQYNGCVQWGTSEASKITLDPETGVLTFHNTKNPYCKIYPGQLGDNKALQEGAALLQFDIYYDDGKTNDQDNFAGISLSYITSKTDSKLLTISSKGKVTALGNDGEAGRTTFGQLVAGWNTLYIYFIPTVDTNGEITKNDVYVRIGNDSNVVPETYGVTLADLQNTNLYTHIVYNEKRYLGGGTGSLGELFFIKPYVEETGDFKLRNVVISNLDADETLYKVSYTGYDTLTAYVPASGTPTNRVTVPTADGVQYWMSGEGTDAKYYTPGDTMIVVSDMTLRPAEDTDLDIAELGAATSRVDITNLSQYTYADMEDALDHLTTAIEKVDQVADFDKTNAFYVNAVAAQDALVGQMAQIESESAQLIAQAKIFSDSNKLLSVRLAAYNRVKNNTYDKTVSSECATAILQLDSFRVLEEAVNSDWTRYSADLTALESADSSTDLRPLLTDILTRIKNLRTVLDEFVEFTEGSEDYTLITTTFSQYLTNSKAEYLKLESMSDKFAYLVTCLTDYNQYKEIVYSRNRVSAVPAALTEMVEDYNTMAQSLNEEALDAMTLSSTLQYTVVMNEDMEAMLTDIKSKVEALSATED